MLKSPPMSNLTVRILSAIFALLILFFSYYLFDLNGILAFGLIVVSIGAWEYSQICLKPFYKSSQISFLFVGSCIALLGLFSFPSLSALTFFAATVCLFLTLSLWLSRERIKTDALHRLLSMAVTGFIYCTLFPSFAFRILLSDQGIQLFMLLLVMVFAGDVFAYFTGRLFGQHRLMPALSPKKTVEGAIGGAIGSVACSMIYIHLVDIDFSLPYWGIGLTAFITSATAQTGDLFESLLKRVAGVKDSGGIMPGHGGVLDRLDGVYFGAPVFYACLHIIIGELRLPSAIIDKMTF
ncbi:MAG: phosphatidate cytidylyltransferase [Bdellovibrionales bacterium]